MPSSCFNNVKERRDSVVIESKQQRDISRDTPRSRERSEQPVGGIKRVTSRHFYLYSSISFHCLNQCLYGAYAYGAAQRRFRLVLNQPGEKSSVHVTFQ